jgi:hypothetical protein
MTRYGGAVIGRWQTDNQELTMNKLLCFLALILSLNAGAQEACPAEEPKDTLTEYALAVAKADGHKQPALVVGVLKVESDVGTASNYRVVKQGTSTFYGAGQLSLAAAKAVMKRFPDLWNDFNTRTDEELKARLILDDRFNVKVTSKYLLISGVNKDARKGVAAYNVGLGGVELINPLTHAYTKKVLVAARL